MTNPTPSALKIQANKIRELRAENESLTDEILQKDAEIGKLRADREWTKTENDHAIKRSQELLERCYETLHGWISSYGEDEETISLLGVLEDALPPPASDKQTPQCKLCRDAGLDECTGHVGADEPGDAGCH